MIKYDTTYDYFRNRFQSLGFVREGDDTMIDALIAVMLTLQYFNLSGDEKEQVLRAFLGEHHKLPEGQWVPFDYGNVRVGDYVRVKKDAYTSDTGVKHNGLVGILRHIYAGRCIVEYVGLETGNTMTHPMDSLESYRVG